MKQGYDISEWQSSIPAGGEFIIIRAGHGTTIDKKFLDHYNNAKKRNIPIGVYWYSYALNVDQAKKEAEKCLEVIKKCNITLGIWFDMEDADGYKKKKGFSFSKTNISNICNTFCEVIEKAGYYAGIYANYSYFINYISCPKYGKWIASWGRNSGKPENAVKSQVQKLKAEIWQYTSKANGLSLDGDIIFSDNISYFNKQPEKAVTIDDIIDELRTKVTDTLAGKYGNGTARRKALADWYESVQFIINKII